MSAVQRSLRQFTFGTAKTAGRNSSGRITSFHHGCSAKRLQRTIYLKRNVSSSMGIVERIEYDPNSSSNIALIRWLQGVKPQLPHHRLANEAKPSSATPPRKVLEAEPSSDITGVFAINSMLPPPVGTTARDIFLSILKRGGKREGEPLALGLPRIAFAAAKPEFFAARGKVMAMIRPALFHSSLRSFATSAKFSHHNNHRENHKYLESNSFLGSWQAPKDPKEAGKKLALLRREYAKQTKEVRKEYIRDMELMALEKQRKDETRREALRVANEERRKLKAEAAKVRAQERQIAQQQFRETLLKERAEKLEYWRMQTKKHGEKKAEKKELLRKQSSIWIDEGDLEKKILDAAAAQYWRMQTKKHGEKKTEKKELLRKQSSIWIDEGDMEKKISDAAAPQH